MAATNDPSNAQRRLQWYDPDLEEVNAHMRYLLETYSKIPPTDVVPHINKIRARGFASNPYPCIGYYRFLNLTLLGHPLYQSIISRLASNPSALYIDLGCCFGQDMRQLVLDGVPSSQLVGVDIEGSLIKLGYDLFQDQQTLQSKFVIADIFQGEAQGESWTGLVAKGADVVHCSAFFHLFPLQEQLQAAKIIGRLVRKGGIIVGRQSGSVKPAELPAIKPGSTSFRHDMKTWIELWEQVGTETGTRWTVDGSLDQVGIQVGKKSAVEDENSRRLLFTITREE